MPTIMRAGPYRLFFYSSDRAEPRHVHIERDDKIAKFWLDPVALQQSGGFNRKEIGIMQSIIDKNLAKLRDAWDDYFCG